MTSTNNVRCAELETASYMLKVRERTLQQLAQSANCRNRVAAETELGRVRAELTATFVSLRQFPRFA